MKATFATVALFVSAGAAPAIAPPAAPASDCAGNGHVQETAHWRNHRDCGWRNGRWVIDLGAGRIVACRPSPPGRDWTWHRDGNREGWWDRHHNRWHYDRW